VDVGRERSAVRYLAATRPETPSCRCREAAVAFGAAGAASFAFLLLCLILRGGIAVRPGWSATFTAGGYRVMEVDPGCETAGLRRGDRILSVDGDRSAALFGPARALAEVAAGRSYSVTVDRDGTIRTIRLRMDGSREDWKTVIPNLIVCLLLYSLGVWIGWAKFRDPTGRLATLAFLLSVFTFFSVILVQFPGWNAATASFALAFATLVRPLNLPVSYHFFSQFPRPVTETGTGVAVLRMFYVAALLLWLPANALTIAQFAGLTYEPLLAFLASLRPDGHPGALMFASFEVAGAVLMGLVLVRNYRHLRDPDSRRRIRWAGLAFGATLGGFFVFATLKLLHSVTGNSTILSLMQLFNSIETVIIGLACFGLAYAVTRHRVLGIHVVIRRGVQYLLARNALRLVTILPLLLLVFEMIRYSDRALRDVLLDEPWPFFVAVTISGAISLRYRRQMRLWLDRRFFRTEAEQESVLLALAEHIKGAGSEAELCLRAAQQLDAAFHPSALHIFVRAKHDGKLRAAYSSAINSAVVLGDWLNEDCEKRLGGGTAFSLYECEVTPATELAEDDPPLEHLVIPIAAAENTNSGVLVFGPKRSEQPYTAHDRALLTAVAGQIALVYEMLALRGHVDREKQPRPAEFLTECPVCGRCYTTGETECTQDGASLSLTLPLERTISGKYRLDRRIGRGGMGVVYQARDLRLERVVAVKVMVGDLFGNSLAQARFEREARIAGALSHPNVVAVHDFGRLAASGAYLVMQLVDGASWRQQLRDGYIPLQRLSSWMNQLCSAVEAAHTKGIIHRDLKPENIMIAATDSVDRVIVLDFGLAKIWSARSDADNLTLPGMVMGTRGYMSPEQRTGRKVGSPGDVFAVAVICAETVSGRRPPRNGASRQWLRSALKHSGLGGSLLERCLERCLLEQPSRRPLIAELRGEIAIALAEAQSRPAARARSDDVETISLHRNADRGQ